jgi:hypothetical protein
VLPRPTVAATRTPPSALPCPWGSLSPMVAGAALATQAHTFSYHRCCFVCCRGLCLLTGWAFELVKVNGGGGVCIFSLHKGLIPFAIRGAQGVPKCKVGLDVAFVVTVLAIAPVRFHRAPMFCVCCCRLFLRPSFEQLQPRHRARDQRRMRDHRGPCPRAPLCGCRAIQGERAIQWWRCCQGFLFLLGAPCPLQGQ